MKRYKNTLKRIRG